MSVAHYVFPLSMVREDKTFCSRLEAEGLRLPDAASPGRFPTLRELRLIIEGLDGYRVASASGPTGGEVRLDVLTDQGITLIEVSGCRSEQDVDRPCEFYFPKGQQRTILEITRRLIPICGPLVLTNDLGECMILAGEATK